MEQSPKTTGRRCIVKAHPLKFPDGVIRRGDVWHTATEEWYADYAGITYAIYPPDFRRPIVIQESPSGGPILKRIEL